jgi:hypothetical protein
MQYIGRDKPVVAQTSGDVDLHVYPACNQTAPTCDVAATYEGSSTSSSVAWTAVSSVEYLLLVTSKSSSSTAPKFSLRIFDTNDSCDKAFGPISPGGDTLLSGSTSAGAAVNPALFCGEASGQTTSGSWYTITGDGGVITASTCSTGTDFDSQISVFTGDSCSQLTCVDGNDDACGRQSLVTFRSNQDQSYYVVVHGTFGASGSFALQIIPTVFTSLFDMFVYFKVSSQALEDSNSPQYAALDWMTNNDTIDLQFTLSYNALLERFAVILLYFTTGGPSWLDPAGFLSTLDTCSWNSVVDEKGVGCNEKGSVVKIQLSKFLNSSST